MGLLILYFGFILLSLILVFLAWRIGESMSFDNDKLSSFECGFVSFQGSRLTFSLQFFLIAIIFLIFDVEIALVLPIPVVYEFVSSFVVVMVFLVFSFVMLGGLYYEWSSGVLDWAY